MRLEVTCRLIRAVAHAATLLWSSEAYPLTQQGHYKVLRFANSGCEAWTSARKGPRGAPVAVGLTGWVLGYISAVNEYGPWSADVTQGTDTDSVFAWIDNYCAQHPLNNVDDATEVLLGELGAKNH